MDLINNQLSPMSKPKHKRLYIRMSSLGDVVLATSALEVPLPEPTEIHWLVADEYAPLLQGHPAIQRLWQFSRKAGLSSWVRLCRELWAEDYSEVIDLHLSLRSRIARLLFLYWDLVSLRERGQSRERRQSRGRGQGTRWRSIKKQKLRLMAYYI